MYLQELARNARALKPLELLRESIQENAEYIADLNTSQLSKGKDSKGDNLETYRSASYAQLKAGMGSEAPLGIPDLKFEGDFYAGFNVKADDNGFVITSSDSKTGSLKGRYGDDIFGLGDQSLKDLKSVLLPTYLKKIKDGLLRK